MDSSTNKEVEVEFPGLIRVFKDGSVERLFASHHVPPTPKDPKTGVASKDVKVSNVTNLSARLYLPNQLTNNDNQKTLLPILVYFHGGAFCLESPFSFLNQRYMNILASMANVIVVSVEYRLAPEHPLPAAYEDCWTALNWAASCSDPWLANHGDLEAVFIGGDSAGGNIVHNIGMRVGNEGLLNFRVKVLGVFLSHPYFLDEKTPELEVAFKIWDFVYPTASGGSKSYLINPMADGAPCLSAFGCGRVLVVVAEKDKLRDCTVRYCDAVKKSGFQGVIELFEVKGEDHCFHAFNPDTENATILFNRLATFLQK